jgi:U32 family peptidase
MTANTLIPVPKNKPELLMPAGSLEKLKTALLYGADAVYLGTPDMSLRTQSSITLEELKQGVDFAHELGKKVYLTLNLFSHNRDIEKLPKFVDTIREVGPDGVIVADPGVFQYIKEQAPELELHVSTQANVCSWLTVNFWQKQGAALVVMAREVSFEEIKEIRERCPEIRLEIFVHGAMCMTYSGRCLLSNYMSERGSNQGNCAHSCRWDYKVHLRLKDGSLKDLHLTEETKELFDFFLEEEYRPGEYFPLEQDGRGAYILNSKDLCLLPRLPEILAAGINSLKVEGRNKSAFYVASVTRVYRQAIDDWFRDPDGWKIENYLEELYAIPNRGYSLAFHDGRLTNLSHNYYNTHSLSDWESAGYVKAWEEDALIFEIKNFLEAGELLQFLSPGLRVPIRVRLQTFEDAITGKITEKVSAGQGKAIRIPLAIFSTHTPEEIRTLLPVMSVARKETVLSEEHKTRLIADLESQYLEIEGLKIDTATRESRLAENREMQAMFKQKKVVSKGPRMGLEGCCGKGCNGCRLFWLDPKFAKAREKLEEKTSLARV